MSLRFYEVECLNVFLQTLIKIGACSTGAGVSYPMCRQSNVDQWVWSQNCLAVASRIFTRRDFLKRLDWTESICQIFCYGGSAHSPAVTKQIPDRGDFATKWSHRIAWGVVPNQPFPESTLKNMTKICDCGTLYFLRYRWTNVRWMSGSDFRWQRNQEPRVWVMLNDGHIVGSWHTWDTFSTHEIKYTPNRSGKRLHAPLCVDTRPLRPSAPPPLRTALQRIDV